MSDNSDYYSSDSESSDSEEEMPLFPYANFKVAIEPYKLNDLITKKAFIVIKIPHDCICLEGTCDQVVYLVENRGLGIRIKDLLWEMVLNDYRPQCAHCVLTGFREYSELIYTPIFVTED